MKKLLIGLFIGIMLFTTIPVYALTAEEIKPYVGKVVDIQLYVPFIFSYIPFETRGKILEVYEDELLGIMVKLVLVNMVGKKVETEIKTELITYISDGESSVGKIIEE